MSFIRSSSLSSLLAASTTFAPSAAIWQAVARPMPDEAPVTTATLPSSLCSTDRQRREEVGFHLYSKQHRHVHHVSGARQGGSSQADLGTSRSSGLVFQDLTAAA